MYTYIYIYIMVCFVVSLYEDGEGRSRLARCASRPKREAPQRGGVQMGSIVRQGARGICVRLSLTTATALSVYSRSRSL